MQQTPEPAVPSSGEQGLRDNANTERQAPSAPPSSTRSSATGTKAQDASDRAALARLWELYEEAVLPLEQRSHYGHFYGPPITHEEHAARPQVLLLGQYSTGKTSMVRWLTRAESPHFDVRPQPSTDKFMAVVHGEQERLIHGAAATCFPQLPYQGLGVFGVNFLNSFSALALPSETLRDITFVDTPGVLAGREHKNRDYDFTAVCVWMATRADVILLTFDAHKLDISDEFFEVIEALRPFADKVRCVLNKADQIDATNLVRVNGALLWNVGKVLRTPEVAKVFVSSFWDAEYRYKDHQGLFEEDKRAILDELRDLPRRVFDRKVDALVQRVRRVRAHMAITSHVRSQLPWTWVAIRATVRLRRWLHEELPRLFEEAQRARSISAGDMPCIKDFQAKLDTFEDLTKLPSWNGREIARLDRVLEVEIPALVRETSDVTAPPTHTKDDAEGSATRPGFLSRFRRGGPGTPEKGVSAKRQRAMS
mmetsp:Transcript_105847/g.210382  ORF Transcript_105847/g.210382 Transcript_105847/m.210382 type:complete len:481 (-) Transcript_105847:69-1511(-)